jgi:hypothetical protein
MLCRIGIILFLCIAIIIFFFVLALIRLSLPGGVFLPDPHLIEFFLAAHDTYYIGLLLAVHVDGHDPGGARILEEHTLDLLGLQILLRLAHDLGGGLWGLD